jgi:hypothetical protein
MFGIFLEYLCLSRQKQKLSDFSTLLMLGLCDVRADFAWGASPPLSAGASGGIVRRWVFHILGFLKPGELASLRWEKQELTKI